MSREGKIHTICHLYPILMTLHMQFLDWRPVYLAAWNIVPAFFVLWLIRIWKHSSHIRLCDNEKRSLDVFVCFFVVLHLYYAVCAFIQGTVNGDIWILEHNLFFYYFIVSLTVFYIIYYLVNRKRS